MRFLDFFITTCLLFWTLFSSATRSIINASDLSKTAPSTFASQPHTSISVTKQTLTTSESTLKETTNTTFISNITTQPAIHITSSLTVQTTSTTIQSLATNISSYTPQTLTSMTTTTSNTTQTPTTNIPSQTTQTSSATTTTSNTTTQPTTTNLSTHTTQRLTSTTTTTSNSTELPTTKISNHTTLTSTATTTSNKTTKQPSNTSTQTTETPTTTTTKPSNSTETTTITIPNHTPQTLTLSTTTMSNTTHAPTSNISNHTSETLTPTTIKTRNTTKARTTSISNHTSQTSFPTITTTINPTVLPTTNISSQTTQTSTHTTFTTNRNTTLLSTASPSTQTSLSTTIEEILTSANIPKQTTRESSNTTTATAAVESSSQEHIINNSKNTTPTENDTSQPTSTQINTINSLSSTSSSSTTPPTSSSRTSTSPTSTQQTTVNPVKKPHVTLVPTEMLSLGINNTLSIQFTMLITMNRSGLESFNETIFSYMLVGYVFVGYEFIPTLHVSNPLSKNIRHRREETSESNSNEANYTTTIIADIPVNKLREQRMTIKEFASDISNNIRHNISNFTSPAWHAVNNSDEIEKQLKSQTEGMSECDASGKLCPLGYDCDSPSKDHYTGICFHKCDLEKKKCKNNGHCIFDSMNNKIACSCQSSWITLYYGASCEEQTGKLETVIGFTLGSAVLVIVLVFIAVLCCIRNRDGGKEFRRHDDKSALESDFLSDSGGVQIMDLNYRKSTKFNPSSLDVDPVLKTLDPGPADVNVSEILETSGCSTISSSNSNKTFKEDENKHQESTMSRDSDVRKPEDNNYVPTDFQSTCPPASTPEISRVSMKRKQENRINNRQTSFLFGP